MLGFELEGYMKAYRPDGADMLLTRRGEMSFYLLWLSGLLRLQLHCDNWLVWRWWCIRPGDLAPLVRLWGAGGHWAGKAEVPVRYSSTPIQHAQEAAVRPRSARQPSDNSRNIGLGSKVGRRDGGHFAGRALGSAANAEIDAPTPGTLGSARLHSTRPGKSNAGQPRIHALASLLSSAANTSGGRDATTQSIRTADQRPGLRASGG